MMTKEGSTKFVNFMTPKAGVLMQRRGHISHTVKMHYIFENVIIDQTNYEYCNEVHGNTD